MRAPLALLALALTASSCAHVAAVDRPDRTLAALRRAARGRGLDDPAQRDLALAELVAPNGDPGAAARWLDAHGNAPVDDVRVPLARSLVALQRGDFARALVDLVATVDHARTSSDPLASACAEVAVSRLADLRADVTGFDPPVDSLVERVVHDPGALDADVRFALFQVAVRRARERGSHEREAAVVRAAGCITEWRVAGPFGPHPMLRFDETLAPEHDAVLADRYDAGPGRGVRDNYDAFARGCGTNLGHGRTDDGAFFAATEFTLGAPTTIHLRTDSPNVYSVFLDGARVATVDDRRVPSASAVTVSATLGAGTHTLRMKIASRYYSPLVYASVTDASGRPVATFARPTHAAAATAPANVHIESTVPADYERDPFARYVTADLLFGRHDVVGARERMRPLADTPHAAPQVLLGWGAVALNDPFVPPNVGRDRARRAFESVQRAAPDAFFPALALADLASADDRADDALALTRGAAARFPDNPEVLGALVRRLADRGWDAESREVLAHARTVVPEACWPIDLDLRIVQRRGDGASEREVAQRLVACNAQSDVAAVAAVHERRWDDARAEFERLLTWDRGGRGLRRALVDLARQRGDTSGALASGAEALGDNPQDVGLRGDLADMLTASGHRNEALALLEGETQRDPATMADLRRIHDALTHTSLFRPFRQDGIAVLAAFDRAQIHYEASAVLVLDYTVRRVFEDGSALELTHNVVRIQSQEGIEAYATLHVPQGATVLTLHTLKADGRVLEPESIARLDAVEFPEVRVGDTIEFEYVRSLGRSETAPGGFVTDRFYFRGFDVPYDRSELHVVLPATMAAHAVFDPRGPAPEVVRRELDDQTVELTWGVRHSARAVPEARSVAAREFIPSIAVGTGGSWSSFVDALRDRLADTDTIDPDAQRLVAQIAGNARTADEKLARLHAWVVEHIEQEGGGTPFASAPVMLAARAGHRARVLAYMLGLAGVPSQLALVHQANDDATEGALADDDTYGALLLRVALPGGVRWVTVGDREAPASWLPPLVAGETAMLVAPGAPRERLPAFDPSAHGRDVSVHLTLRHDGTGEADVTEHLRGAWAISWRQMLRGIEPANLEREFEGYVGRQVTAASLESLHIDGREDPASDLVLHYRFRAPGLLATVGDGAAFEGIYAAEAGPTYARLPTRTTTLYNPEALNATLDLRVTLPNGFRADSLPPPAEGHAPGIRWTTSHVAEHDGFRYRRSVQIPPGRVSPSDYGAFAAQVRAFDAADTVRVHIAAPH